MNKLHYVLDLLLLAVIILVLDAVFLGSLRNYFNNQVRKVQGSNLHMNYIAAVLAYIVIIGCVYRFVVLNNASLLDAALLGWSVYLIYELTNKAILNNWDWLTVLIDGLWGGVLFALTTYLFRLIKKTL